MAYRTPEQFAEVCENAYNGNWTDAAQNCVDYGFFANDLIRADKSAEENGEEWIFTDKTDIALIVEMAADIRNKA